MAYSINGRQKRIATKAENLGQAERILNVRRAEVAQGKHPTIFAERTTYEQLRELIISDYKIRKLRTLGRLEDSLKHLDRFFAGKKAIDITSAIVDKYILKRQKKDAANGTINAELSALRRMFNLGFRRTPQIVTSVPYIRKLDTKNNVRQGFYTNEEYLQIRDALPEHLKGILTVAYYTGMRKGEILGLTWVQVNVFKREIDMEPGAVKNSESRVIPLRGELLEAIIRQKNLRDSLYPRCPFVFFKAGERIKKDFRTEWNRALRQCGFIPTYKCKQCYRLVELMEGVNAKELTCPHCGHTKLSKHDRHFHDNRRTGVRNLMRATRSRKIAKKISGHKTDTVFERYDITVEDDLTDAMEKIVLMHEGKPESELPKNEPVISQIARLTKQ